MLGSMKRTGTRIATVIAAVVLSAGCAGGGGSPTPSAAGTPSGGLPGGTPVPSAIAPPTPAPSATAGPSATATASATALDLQKLLDEERSSYGAPGALAVLRVGEARTAATSGKADTAGTPIAETTRFRIASITKPIVATLVLDAVAQGRVSLDDVVGDLLPGTVRATPPITVRQILDHTSGVFDEGNDGDPVADIANLTDPALRAEAQAIAQKALAGEHVIAPGRLLVALAETHDRYFAPGTGFHYSNMNYQIAAMILEKVTGRTLADLLRTRIVEPLGLTHTTIAPPDTASPEFRGYGTNATNGTLVDMTDDLVFFGNGGHGGIISTANELLTIMRAIVSGRLLPAALVTDMKTPHAKDDYGLGLATYHLSCGTFYGHEGGVNGTASIAIVSSDGADGVVAALNLRSAGDPQLPALADRILCSGG
jgi:D-alanyl-D-alanine carboxypeptidase